MSHSTEEFKIFGQKWGVSQVAQTTGGTVTYSYANANFGNQFADFDSFITEDAFQTDITSAFAAWEDVANVQFKLVSDSSNVDIRIGWANIDGEGGTLGAAIVPSSGPLDNVIIRFDRDENWFTGGSSPPSQTDFVYVATHEIGHAIGIDHSTDTSALMSEFYNRDISGLQADDIAAAEAIYGSSNIEKIDVFRFLNSSVGGHFFTAETSEKDSVVASSVFQSEGIGFEALSQTATDVELSIPIYRFFNKNLGSHFFTASEEEKSQVELMDEFNFEGVGFRAFNEDTASTEPVYRFFNINTGGHFFTADSNEQAAVMNFEGFRFEGVGFYAYLNTDIA
ncbi:matrixin family metalloprotease [Nisaea sp.]|uniref:matrixin family metalloprotease n=1 Tax=Nisaea sp. TaxID=2024842 RepID=UPI00326640C2